MIKTMVVLIVLVTTSTMSFCCLNLKMPSIVSFRDGASSKRHLIMVYCSDTMCLAEGVKNSVRGSFN